VTLDRLAISYARDLHVDDLKESNVILLGSSNGNPWVSLFDSNLNFHIEYVPENRYKIWNKAPRAGESATYYFDPRDPQHLPSR
jgi:hypothetical protein